VQLTIVGKVFVVPLVVLMMVVLVEDSLQSEERTKSQMIEDGITTNSDVPSTCIHVLYTGLHAGRGPGEGRELTMGKESSFQAEGGLPWYGGMLCRPTWQGDKDTPRRWLPSCDRPYHLAPTAGARELRATSAAVGAAVGGL
jgi:hypothetical protein